MRIFVTGGTGVVGRSTVTALIQHGHVVTLFSRHAQRDAEQWSQGVHPVAGDVNDAASLNGAADGCEAVLHLTGIVEETGTKTFERVNVQGTRNVLQEAERAGVKRFIYVSSLGAERGESPYHQSKRKAEALVREFKGGGWIIIRPGNVFGPGDDQISLLLRMIRTLPTIPVIGTGDQAFQPIWHEDLAEVLSRAIERNDLHGRTLDVAGAEQTSQKDLVRRLATITRRDVTRIPIPEILATVGARVADAVGMDVGLSDSQIRMITEGNVIPTGRDNALVTEFQMTPTPLDNALATLADHQQEQLPDDGVGPLRRKRYSADISASRFTPEQLMEYVRTNFAELMASFIDTHPERASDIVQEDATLTLSLPLRGHMQVRVAELEPNVATLVTLRGHPLAGAIRFLTEQRGVNVRFEVQIYDRAANVVDLVMMRTVGELLQDAAWRETVNKVVKATGGVSSGVRVEAESLDDDQADRIEDWLRELVTERKREEAGI